MMLGEAKDAVTCVSAARGMGEARIATSSVDGKVRAGLSCVRVDDIRIPLRVYSRHARLDAPRPSRFFSRFRVPCSYSDCDILFFP